MFMQRDAQYVAKKVFNEFSIRVDKCPSPIKLFTYFFNM